MPFGYQPEFSWEVAFEVFRSIEGQINTFTTTTIEGQNWI
jgi:hypothetical protein